jgi:hypothetical protein
VIPLCAETKFPLAQNEVDYSDFSPRQVCDAIQSDGDNFFHGILNYIFFNSENCYNHTELLIEYRAIQPGSDPAFILDYRNPRAYQSGTGPGQCLVLTFRRIRIRPTAYAIKSGPLSRTTRHIASYVFQGWDAAAAEWVVLDERQNLLEYLTGFTARLSHLDTAMYFSKFRLLQTDQTPPPGTHFGVSALEIHGQIDVPSARQAEPDREAEFDPWTFRDSE